MDPPGGPFANASPHALSNHFSHYGADPAHHVYPPPAGTPFPPAGPQHPGLEGAPRQLTSELFAAAHGSYAPSPHHTHHGLPLHIAPPPASPFGPPGRLTTGPLSSNASTPQHSAHPVTPQHSVRFDGLPGSSPQTASGSFLPRHEVPSFGEHDAGPAPLSAPAKTKGQGTHFEGLKMIKEPPNLAVWREKLFDVQGTLHLTEDEFQTYFPHVDNVYSHRSTQRHKRHRFVSHYWDCRLIGRPSGTPKSDDPAKRKRKRVARPRDLCDVKIKIVEVYPPAADEAGPGGGPDGSFLAGASAAAAAGSSGAWPGGEPVSGGGMTTSSFQVSNSGQKRYEISRVSASDEHGLVNRHAAGHRHSLAESDRIKKNSVQRHFATVEKEMRTQAAKTYHKKATGAAAETAKRHGKAEPLKLFSSCFCPFAQRVWIVLELKGIPYQYVEVDPYQKPKALLDVNPLGLVPALRHGDWACHESTVLVEYLEDIAPTTHPLLPSDPKQRAHARLWADHVHRKVIPTFYQLLQAQEADQQAEHAAALHAALATLVDAADPQGPFFAGAHLSFVDVQLAPWLLRFRRVLGPYRGWPGPEAGTRWARWVEAVEGYEADRRPPSGDELYLDSYERYAQNRPHTSQVADAINSGRPLP